MRFEDLPLSEAKLIHGEPNVDERGYFERIFCADTLLRAGIQATFPQASLSSNELAGTRRGLHFQRHPHAEAKLVRCVTGEIFDVILDIRPASRTFGRWHAVRLAVGDHRSLFIPEGFAHGFQTLKDQTTLLYFISKPHAADHAGGISGDDPSIGIAWPGPPTRIVQRDREWPLLAQLDLGMQAS
jgi:dTDP-4-dehydrorhamnose 3,5-epimerase